MNPLTRFDSFLFDEDAANAMRSEFSPVLTNVTLARDSSLARVLETHKNVSGVYFWVLRHESKEYKVYIGQTNSLADRLLTYVSNFQAHSPNDYKLRIFGAFLAEFDPAAALDLYFMVTDRGSLNKVEKDAIRRYNPLLNKLPAPSIEAKQKLQSAFDAYYRSALEQCLEK